MWSEAAAASNPRWRLGHGHRYPAFISHYKVEAGDCARILKDRLTPLLGCEPFLDSDNVMHLGQLVEQVRLADTLVLLQTKDVLTRPWCLVELYAAVRAGVPIVAVSVTGKGYDHEASKRYLAMLPGSLEEANPGAVQVSEGESEMTEVYAQSAWPRGNG